MNGFSPFHYLIRDFFNKDTEIVPETLYLILLYSKSTMCIAKNGKNTKYVRHISRRVYFVRN